MLSVYPNPGIMSTQSSGTTVRNCASDVQKSTDTNPAWARPLSCILTTFSSTIYAVAAIPFEDIKRNEQSLMKILKICPVASLANAQGKSTNAIGTQYMKMLQLHFHVHALHAYITLPNVTCMFNNNIGHNNTDLN